MQSTNFYKELIEHSLIPQFIYQEEQFNYVNPAFSTLFGYEVDDFTNNRITLAGLFHLDSYEYIIQNGLEKAKLKTAYRLKGMKKNGDLVHLEVYSHLLSDSYIIIGSIIDVTKQVILEEQLKLSEKRYESFFYHNSDMIYSIDLNGQIISMNPACEHITGYKPEDVIGQSFTPFIVVEDIPEAMNHFSEAQKGNTQQFEIAILDKEGKRVELSCASIPIIVNDEIVGVYGIGKDVTEKKKAEEQANFFAYYDPLTNLPNRRLFEDRLSHSFSYTKQAGKMAVMFIDIDRFKLINDSFGHKTGDQLIQLVAERLKSQVRETDTVARLGGDEFTILLPDLNDNNEPIEIAERIIKAMEKPFELNDMVLTTTSSIGISITGACENYHTLLQQADLAMYQAKSNGRNGYAVYTRELDTKADHRIRLENDLRRALEQNEFELHYQPIIELSTNEIRAVEALLRWNHPELGAIPPLEFIPIAEDTGLINEIGDWVLRNACIQNKQWQEESLIVTRVAVNVSIKQLQLHDFTERVNSILTETQLEPKWLSLEITESEMMKNQHEIIETLSKIRAIGVKIFIDDFGTGYSSLSYLKQLPIDYVKIDKSFIQDIGIQSGDAIIKAILTLTKQLNLKTVAEGVESEQQFEFLTKEYCEESQGYFISAPLPGPRIREFLEIRNNQKLVENQKNFG
ncbi:EAL domain-containing protein [Bacillus sp. AK128]